jgi:hypothetical protein
VRQRLGIAAALLRSPRLLLLDEPTSGLDPAGARDVAGLVRRLAAEGTAVLLSSHLIGELVVSPLESMFFALTSGVELDAAALSELIEAAMSGAMSATHALRPGDALAAGRSASSAGIRHVYRAERRKLSAQLSTRLLALICVLGPFVFAGVLKIQTGSPADTLLVLLAVASLAAGLLLVGPGKLVSLGGVELSSGHSLLLVIAAWLLNIPPMLAFVSLAVLLSLATRNGIVGVSGPALLARVMQLLLLVGTGVWLHMLLVARPSAAGMPCSPRITTTARWRSHASSA